MEENTVCAVERSFEEHEIKDKSDFIDTAKISIFSKKLQDIRKLRKQIEASKTTESEFKETRKSVKWNEFPCK